MVSFASRRAQLLPDYVRVINRFQLLRNVGQFDSVAAGANLPLAGLSVVYAENGRGKTTLAAILRSLATGDPIPVAERHPSRGDPRAAHCDRLLRRTS